MGGVIEINVHSVKDTIAAPIEERAEEVQVHQAAKGGDRRQRAEQRVTGRKRTRGSVARQFGR